MSKAKTETEKDSFRDSILFESIVHALTFVTIVAVCIVGIWLTASSLANTINDARVPVRYYEETSVLEIHPLDGGDTFQRVDTDSGFVYIISRTSGGLFSINESSFQKLNSDGSLYIMPKAEIENHLKIANKTIKELKEEEKAIK